MARILFLMEVRWVGGNAIWLQPSYFVSYCLMINAPSILFWAKRLGKWMWEIVFTDAAPILWYLGLPNKPEMIVKEQWDHLESRNYFVVNIVSDFSLKRLCSCIWYLLNLQQVLQFQFACLGVGAFSVLRGEIHRLSWSSCCVREGVNVNLISLTCFVLLFSLHNHVTLHCLPSRWSAAVLRLKDHKCACVLVALKKMVHSDGSHSVVCKSTTPG